MNFTNSPFESVMKRVPPAPRPFPCKPPVGSVCCNCPYWRGMACVGICYKLLTSGQLGPKSRSAGCGGVAQSREGRADG